MPRMSRTLSTMKEMRDSNASIASSDALIEQRELLTPAFQHRQIRSLFINVIKFAALAAAFTAGAIGTFSWSDWSILSSNDGRLRHQTTYYHNQFLTVLHESLYSDQKSLFTPLVITKDGTRLLCPPRLVKDNESLARRIKHFSQMIQTGLQTHHLRRLSKHGDMWNKALPLLLMGEDNNGCDIAQHADYYDFPRLAWSIPSEVQQGSEWCHAISVPSYEIWKTFGKTDKRNEMKNNERLYPWNTKIPKAIWRGSTTNDANQYSHVSFHDIPRAKLVQASKDHPDVIDAAFTKIHQRFANMTEEIEETTIVAERILFDDQMKYKAIIDIDGNSWSSRFSKLLCTNSVVIKIVPDFIEYFYNDLIANKHYISASLSNITQVAEYVLNESNNEEMKKVVEAANSWCKQRMIKSTIVNDAMKQMETYFVALNNYTKQDYFHDEWKSFIRSAPFDDFVEC